MLKPLFRAAIAATFLVLCATATAADSVIVITTHGVADFDSAKPNLVTIVLAGESLENAKKFVSEVKERMKNNKIIVGEPDIKIGTIAK